MTVHNLVIHGCIIDEGTSTCIMSTHVQKNIISPKLEPSLMTLCDYDGYVAQPQGLLSNVTIDLDGKLVLIDIEVVNSNTDYNLLLVCSYMYAMKAVASSVFRLVPSLWEHFQVGPIDIL